MSLPNKSVNSPSSLFDHSSTELVTEEFQVSFRSDSEATHNHNQRDQDVSESSQGKADDESRKTLVKLSELEKTIFLSNLPITSGPGTSHGLKTTQTEQKPHASLSQDPRKEELGPMPPEEKSKILSSVIHEQASLCRDTSNFEGCKDASAGTTRNSLDHETKDAASETIAAAKDGDSKSEIQNIMDQFDHGESASEDEVKPSTSGFSDSPLGGSLQHPPRKSSLEPTQSMNPQAFNVHWGSTDLASPNSSCIHDSFKLQRENLPEVAAHMPSDQGQAASKPAQPGSIDREMPTSPSFSLRKPLPPEPDPEPDLPFDFHRFLEQLRHRTADPVAKFLRSFLVEFGKKQWMAHEQVKIISDFLTFISSKMAQCDIWHGVSEAEFDNAKEGMEKLVMNRLYSQTFSPSIPPPISLPGNKGKAKNTEKVLEPGRRGQHQEDIERDDILSQKVRIYGWIEEGHLDIPPVGDQGRRFLALAQQELLKIKTYRAPRDKIICVLNCCKVIFGLLRNSKASDTSADSFIPLLIYVVIHANPDHLVSNVQYILRFRNQDKLGGEAGYYLSSLMGAIQFIENLDRTSLTISDSTFERNVEAAVSAIVERHGDKMPPPKFHQVSEKSGISEPETIPRNSEGADHISHRRLDSSDAGRTDQHFKNNGSDETRAVSGLLRSIQKPLTSIGRIFSEEQPSYPPPSLPPRLSPTLFQPRRNSSNHRRSFDESQGKICQEQSQLNNLTAEEAAIQQASAESAEAQRIQVVEHNDVVETLAGMFPNLERDIIDDVVRVKQGRVGLAVDACLGLSS